MNNQGVGAQFVGRSKYLGCCNHKIRVMHVPNSRHQFLLAKNKNEEPSVQV
jgi:hypothetical protein